MPFSPLRLLTGGLRSRSRSPFAALALLLPLIACAAQPQPPGFGMGQPMAQAPALPQVARTRVGLLLPLSGSNRALGQAMFNAAQLALFDQADPRVEFLPEDTGGTAQGAAGAARQALNAGARVLAGPLTSAETNAAAAPARAGRLPLLAFTNDGAIAGNGVWALGITPAQQADRMVGAALAAGASRFALLGPADEFGRRMAQAVQARLAAAGLPAPVVLLHPTRTDIGQAVRDLAAQAGGSQPGETPVDALLLVESGANARAAAAAVPTAFPRAPRLLGTVLWSLDASLAQDPALSGAWFPAPDPQARQNFEGRYLQAFGERPPRLAGVAYDAAGLAARAARDGGALPIGEAFMGADGPIRMLPDGQVARGLAVFAFDGSGEPRLVQPAPVPGAAGS